VGFFDFGWVNTLLSGTDSSRFAALASEPGALLGVQGATAHLAAATTQTTVMRTLAEIEAEVGRLSERIAAPRNAHPTFGYSADFARPHIEVGDGQYHYVAVERGTEVFRKSTSDLDELLYWIFDGVTFSMACAYELEHRIPGQDFRRLMFSKRVELLTSIDPDMGRRAQEQIAETLRNAPFNDGRA
jgi:hypothetical protein